MKYHSPKETNMLSIKIAIEKRKSWQYKYNTATRIWKNRCAFRRASIFGEK
jgi:hypothetical protein